MPDFDSILPNLKRVGETTLDDSDKAKLREFFAQFVNESDTELERKRGVMRERLRVRTVIVRGQPDVEIRRDTTWKNPQLDQAKFDILTAIIQERTTLAREAPRGEDIVQLKPGLYGMSLNLNALYRKVRKLFRRKSPD